MTRGDRNFKRYTLNGEELEDAEHFQWSEFT